MTDVPKTPQLSTLKAFAAPGYLWPLLVLALLPVPGRGADEQDRQPSGGVDPTLTREQLRRAGSPDLARLARELPQMVDSDTQANSFDAEGLEAMRNFNLRGLGPGRSRVLLDGQPLGYSPLGIAQTGELFADFNLVPQIALEAVELSLTPDGSGASAPGAVAGTVNLRTREDFSGNAVSYSNERADGSAGDEQLGMLWGIGSTKSGRLLLAIEGAERNVLARPGSVGIGRELLPECLLAEPVVTSADCTPNREAYTHLVNAEQNQRFYIQYAAERNDGSIEELSLLWARTAVQAPVPPGRALRADQLPSEVLASLSSAHPAVLDARARNPAVGINELQSSAWPGLGQTPDVSKREQLGRRLAFSRTSARRGKTAYRIEGLIAHSQADLTDVQVDSSRLQWALAGFGGPSCGAADAPASTLPVPGQGGCEYYNPFLTGQAHLFGAGANPLLDRPDGSRVVNPSTGKPYTDEELSVLVNSAALLQWLEDTRLQTYKSRLSRLGVDFDIDLGQLSGGQAQLVTGLLWRKETWEVESNLYDGRGSGRFSRAFHLDVTLPFSQLDMHLWLRLEDYGEPTGEALLPGLSLRWHSGAHELHFAWTGGIKAPDLNQLSGGALVPVWHQGRELLLRPEPNSALKLQESTRYSLGWTLSGPRLLLGLQSWQVDVDRSIRLSTPKPVICVAALPACSKSTRRLPMWNRPALRPAGWICASNIGLAEKRTAASRSG